ncbi:hypothetical protein ANN_26727 [Periplaneta americana]|uniref:PiggyBac transposable element-derived protein domain-containing protein n=1 Tax=Periplaneta americana TaxID=6978 RepID=A0ABQ8RYV0_PERAM|nr:hypothetical protein ANN_26727 [Periplaneta americana]
MYDTRAEICRFEKFLHFANDENCDPETQPNVKLNEVWPIFRNLEDKYTPDRDVTIEESLLIYKGRLVWVQYISLKRARFGIKTYMLCESKSGTAAVVVIICLRFVFKESGNSLNDDMFPSAQLNSNSRLLLYRVRSKPYDSRGNSTKSTHIHVLFFLIFINGSNASEKYLLAHKRRFSRQCSSHSMRFSRKCNGHLFRFTTFLKLLSVEWNFRIRSSLKTMISSLPTWSSPLDFSNKNRAVVDKVCSATPNHSSSINAVVQWFPTQSTVSSSSLARSPAESRNRAVFKSRIKFLAQIVIMCEYILRNPKS